MKENMNNLPSLNNLFLPNAENEKQFKDQIKDLYTLLINEDYSYLEKYKNNIFIDNIPYVLRLLGIQNGEICFRTSSAPKITGLFRKTDSRLRLKTLDNTKLSYHNISLPELYEISNIISDPDLIFRSPQENKPNNILLCKKFEDRDPVVIVLNIAEKKTPTKTNLITMYEMEEYLPSRLNKMYLDGYCLYDGESNFSKKIRNLQMNVQIPTQLDGSTQFGSSNNNIIFKKDAVNIFLNNQNINLIIYLNKCFKEQELRGIGYNKIVITRDKKFILNFKEENAFIVCFRNFVQETKDIFPDKEIISLDTLLPNFLSTSIKMKTKDINKKTHYRRNFYDN